MGDLSEELFKAGLISKKQLKATEHDKRVKQKNVGHKALDKEEQRKKAEHEKRRAEQQVQDRERNLDEQAALEGKVTRARLKDIIKHGAVKSGRGNRRFYFVARDGKIPFLEVSDEIARALQYGDLAIVRIPEMKLERFVILPRKTATQVKDIDPDLVVVFR